MMAPPPFHDGRNCAASVEDGVHVEVHGFPEFLGIVIVNGFASGNAGIIAQDVDAAPQFLHFAEFFFYRSGIGQYGGNADYFPIGVFGLELFDGSVGGFLAGSAQGNFCAVLQELADDFEADASGSARDDCDFVFQKVHSSSFIGYLHR